MIVPLHVLGKQRSATYRSSTEIFNALVVGLAFAARPDRFGRAGLEAPAWSVPRSICSPSFPSYNTYASFQQLLGPAYMIVSSHDVALRSMSSELLSYRLITADLLDNEPNAFSICAKADSDARTNQPSPASSSGKPSS